MDHIPRKRKWVAGLLAFCIPGTGHLYLGLMQKGIFLMLLLVLDIFAIVHFSMNMTSIPLITLFALFIPVIYLYNLFDALLCTERINRERERSHGLYGPIEQEHPAIMPAEQQEQRRPYVGWFLIAAGVVFFVLRSRPDWSFLTGRFSTYVGAVLLIGIGVLVYVKDRSK